LIELVDVSFRYGPQGGNVFNNVSIKIGDGEWVEISGGNSSGKTTLCKIISGLLRPQTGLVLIDGVESEKALEDFNARPPVSMTFQNPDNHFLSSTVKDELLFTIKNLSFPEDEIERRFDEAVELFRLSDCLNRNPHRLSGGEKQRLSLAIAWSTGAKHLILDEPLSFLDKEGKDDFLNTLKMAFEGRGTSIIWITLFTGEFRYARRKFAVGNGSVVELDATESSKNIGESLSVLSEKPSLKSPGYLPGARDVLEISKAVFSYDDSGFEIEVDEIRIKDGEFVLVTGLNGSGKTTFMLGASGLLRPVRGTVKILNRQINSKKDFPHGRVGFIFQAPEDTFFRPTVFEEVAFGFPSSGKDGETDEVVSNALLSVGLDPGRYLSKNPYSLSQSEKRLVAIASTVLIDPDIYFFDEPFIFLDNNAMRLVLDLLIDLNGKGKTVIVATHSEELLKGMASRTIRCIGGRCVLDS